MHAGNSACPGRHHLSSPIAARANLSLLRGCQLRVVQSPSISLHCSVVTTASALRWMQAAIKEASAAGKDKEAASLRRQLHVYLHGLFQRDAAAGAEFADLQVHFLLPAALLLQLNFACSIHAREHLLLAAWCQSNGCMQN